MWATHAYRTGPIAASELHEILRFPLQIEWFAELTLGNELSRPLPTSLPLVHVDYQQPDFNSTMTINAFDLWETPTII